MGIFQKSVINKHLTNLDKEQVEKAYQKFKENYSPAKIEKIKQLKEEEYQDGFLRDLFVDVFGYTLKPDDNYNLVREFKNQDDGRKVDGAVLKDEKAIAVIELKSTKTKDLKSITEQAFNYKNNQPNCKYVITSNFQKLRFYIDYANEFEEFDLFLINEEEFERLYLILSTNSVFSDLPLKLKDETKFHEQEISVKLYNNYSIFKNKLFNDLINKNPEYDKLTLFKKSQKLLDRFLFILFAEDSGLLPPNSISRIIKRYEILKEEDAYKPLYDIFKQYFSYMNIGRKGKNTGNDIPAYNGGLFYPDEILDSFKIDNDILIDDLLKLSSYDFNTEVDVNILGHIFEHSLSEIEEIAAEIEGTATDKTKSKRKKDGVFYTPKYITQYIVENTIGMLCNQKRKELEIEEIEFDGTYRTKEENLSAKGKKLYQKLKGYKDWLFSLKIVDPACGSGAFLNQALNYLIQEHKNIDDIIAELTNTTLRLFNTDKAILENNLYGVDINEESIEIAKLSLWLRTAQKGRKLSVLSNNIKCGNSLIDDPEVAGEKAFNWQKEFPTVFEKGGFDVVIGNPPYGAAIQSKKVYLKKFGFSTKCDTYQMFTILGEYLINEKGMCGFIIPNSWMTRKAGTEFRSKLYRFNFYIVIDFVDQVFEDANIDTCIILYSKKINKNLDSFVRVAKIKDPQSIASNISYSELNFDNWTINDKFNCELDNQTFNLIETINKDSKKLGKLSTITGGYKPYQVGYGKSIEGDFPQNKNDVKNHVYHSNKKIDNTYYPDIKGGNIERYFIKPNTQWIKWGDWLMSPKKFEDFINPKIVVREVTGNRINACFDNSGLFTNDTTHMIRGAEQLLLKYFLTIINSSLLGWFFRIYYGESNDLFPKIKVNELKDFPVKDVPDEVQKAFVEKADKMLKLNKQLQEKKNKFLNRVNDNFDIEKNSKKLDAFYDNDFKTYVTELKKQKIKLSLVQQDEWEGYFNSYKNAINQLQVEINKTDKEIDQMVYELYRLTKEEIEIVEKS